MSRPTLTRSCALATARELTPSWGLEFVGPAFDGAAEAAAYLAVSLHDYQRADMAWLMYSARVPPVAFRKVLHLALVQTHCYQVVQVARGRRQLARWCRYARFAIPDDLPDPVTIYRGACGCSAAKAAQGLSWTMDFDVAAFFAHRNAHAEAKGLVVRASVPRSVVLFYSNGRGEREIIPEAAPTAFDVIDDADLIRAGYDRNRAAVRRHNDAMLAPRAGGGATKFEGTPK